MFVTFTFKQFNNVLHMQHFPHSDVSHSINHNYSVPEKCITFNLFQIKMTDKDSKHRKFYEIPTEFESTKTKTSDNQHDIADYIHQNIIGSDTTFLSPFGRKKVVYCDYTASGKALKFIEDFIAQEVLPLYGNTHTTTSVTSLQTTLYRYDM